MDNAQLEMLPNLAVGLFIRCKNTGVAALRPTEDGFESITNEAFAGTVRLQAKGLLHLGLQPGQRVLLMAANSVEWAMLDFAILAVGGVTVPIYPTSSPQDIQHVLQDSDCVFCFLDGQVELQQMASREAWGIPVDHFYLRKPVDRLHSWSDLAEMGREIPDVDLNQRMAQIQRQDMATIVYTSGTTGEPKGVVLSHGNILSNIVGVVPFAVTLQSGQRVLSFLPLAHVFGRVLDHFAAYLFGLEVAYAERPETVLRDLPRARPHLLIAVPRVFQLLYHRLQKDVKEYPGLLGAFLQHQLDFSAVESPTLLNRIAYWLVATRLRQELGGRLQFFVSGGAPLPSEITRFFLRLGLPILEGYGMTEAAAVIAANPRVAIHPGSVGKILPNLECRIADDHEILVKGPSIMRQYWNNPSATEEAISKDWLHTGDIGSLDADGYLTIVDRKKDLIVNTAGENISPQNIETRLAGHPLIDQAAVFGDQSSYLVALIYANHIYASQLLGPTYSQEDLAKAMHTAIQETMTGQPSYEQIRRFALIEQPFSTKAGELTPTLKIKRHIVWAHYGHLLEHSA
jgi:long-chain acyl-CoA synthetase